MLLLLIILRILQLFPYELFAKKLITRHFIVSIATSIGHRMLHRHMALQCLRVRTIPIANRTLEIHKLARMTARNMLGQILGRDERSLALRAQMEAIVRVHTLDVRFQFVFLGVSLVAVRTGMRSFVGVPPAMVRFQLVLAAIGALADLSEVGIHFTRFDYEVRENSYRTAKRPFFIRIVNFHVALQRWLRNQRGFTNLTVKTVVLQPMRLHQFGRVELAQTPQTQALGQPLPIRIRMDIGKVSSQRFRP